MRISEFQAGKYHSYGVGNHYEYFLPTNINQEFEVDNIALQQKLEKSALLLGKLDSLGKMVLDVDLVIRGFISNEATQSSKIEGTQTEISDVFKPEEYIDIAKKDDWKEVNLYIKAMNESVELLKKLPISNRLIKKAHSILLSSGRGSKKLTGKIRESQNWIGGNKPSNAQFVPPHHKYLAELMSDLEKFLNNTSLATPHLVKIGIAHYQFETIHPFLDGNGRIGRMLIPLYLIKEQLLSKPLLYMSAFFEAYKNNYYDKLDKVRKYNDLSGWMLFFLDGIEKSAAHSIDVLDRVLKLKDELTDTIKKKVNRSANYLTLLNELFAYPIIDSAKITKKLSISPTTANKMLVNLVDIGALTEVSKRKRKRLFVFEPYLYIISKPFI